MALCRLRCTLLATLWCTLCAQKPAQPSNESISLYFGNGCFFARQNLFIQQFEQKLLHRGKEQLTSRAGYAGSTKTGPNGSACYHNSKNFSDYGILGHAEVVQVVVPLDSLEKAFAVYFGSFVEIQKGSWVRPDALDIGAEYRSLVGVPGGTTNSKVVEAMRRANVHNMTLRPGHGSDPDTFTSNSVLVMDSTKFPFIQAELCLQFHDDAIAKYPASYHKLINDLESKGRLHKTSCPLNYICNSTAEFREVTLV